MIKEAYKPGTMLANDSNTIHAIYLGISDNKERHLVFNFNNNRIESYEGSSFHMVWWRAWWKT